MARQKADFAKLRFSTCSPELLKPCPLPGLPRQSAGFESLGGGKHLRMLSFSHPGKFMDNFDPERSTREMRKMNRRIYRENLRKNQLYDETGRLIENSKDLCDCLVVDCPGCHYPCNRCGSTKCASECRCSRKYVYEFVEVEGTVLVIKWPSVQEVKS